MYQGDVYVGRPLILDLVFPSVSYQVFGQQPCQSIAYRRPWSSPAAASPSKGKHETVDPPAVSGVACLVRVCRERGEAWIHDATGGGGGDEKSGGVRADDGGQGGRHGLKRRRTRPC